MATPSCQATASVKEIAIWKQLIITITLVQKNKPCENRILSISTASAMRLLLPLLIFALAGCAKLHPVGEAIGKQANASDAQTVRLADATTFAWDQVYLFGPYTGRSTVCEALTIEAGNCTQQITFESSDDSEMSLAFLSQGKLVQYVPHLRKHGDFTPVPDPAGQPIKAGDAVFRVVRKSAAGRRLVLQQAY